MEKKKISCSYSFLVIILFATVCILTDYIVIDRKLREGKSVNSVIEDKSIVNENIVDIRTDSTKDYVYDASYENDGIVESYNTYYNTYFLKDIVVPFININSDDARKLRVYIILLLIFIRRVLMMECRMLMIVLINTI